MPGSVDGHRVAGDGLGQESIDDGPKEAVVVKAGVEIGVVDGLPGGDAEDGRLHDIGDPKPPLPAGHGDEVGIVDLGDVVDVIASPGKGGGDWGDFALIGWLKIALGDVQAALEVLPEAPELYQVGIGDVGTHAPEHPHIAQLVVANGVAGPLN